MMRLYFVLLALAGAASALGTCKTALELCNAQTADIGLIAQATGLQDTLGKSFKGTLFCPSTTAVRAWLKSRGVTSAAQLSAQDLPVYKAVAQTQIVANAVKKPTVGEKLKSDQGTVLTVQSLKPTKIMGGKPGNVATVSKSAKACNKAVVYFTDTVLLPA